MVGVHVVREFGQQVVETVLYLHLLVVHGHRYHSLSRKPLLNSCTLLRFSPSQTWSRWYHHRFQQRELEKVRREEGGFSG